jgi:sugar lactone lactonase YvrE
MFRKTALLLLLLITAFAVYLYIKPTYVDPEKWEVPQAPAFTGTYEANDLLSALNITSTAPHKGPEDVAIDTAGNVYVGTDDGSILLFPAGSDQFTVFAQTGGRPLGLAFDREGNLIVADADKGLLSVDATGKVSVLSAAADGVPFLFTDDVDVAADGKIYFSDASHKFSVHHYKLDLIERRPNGRLLVYDPATGATTTLLDSLYFANGVALSANDDYVLVTETSAYALTRYWLSGINAGERETLIDNLPGFPDGISRGSNGIFWVAIASPRDKALDLLTPYPRVRKMIANLPGFLQPKPKKYGMVLGIDENGKVLHNLQDPKGKFTPITSVEEFGGVLYLGNLTEPGFARMQLSDRD